MKKIVLIGFLIGAVLVPDLFAYVDMSAVTQRANDLGMNTKDYTFAMAIAGTLTGFAFNLFLWKVK
ncbi:hypothetical protein [Sulfuricurvum sp.]|uniref:hypothetical protein n=1 Tax=Sulfuricurvum sp. TaxID=2025608 RepID=UPI002607AFD7|nr:hypothetical protein [Sulfuricurvum sp.]MDD3596746.1 hypothetical protein [Sulfuricurvum sp.]